MAGPLHWYCVSTRDAHDITAISTADHFPVCIDVSLQCIPEVEIANASKLHGLARNKVSQDGKN